MPSLTKFISQRAEERRGRAMRALIHREAQIGGELFGPIAPGGRREFFCLDERTWVWHEEWIDTNGHYQAKTTRYDVRPNGVLKSQGTSNYQALSRDELANFRQAVMLYTERVGALYSPYIQRIA